MGCTMSAGARSASRHARQTGAVLAACLAAATVGGACETDWPARAPLIRPHADGVVVLNAEAAAYVMDDKAGHHVLNWTDPRIEIVDGRLTRLGSGFQFPAWRLQVPAVGRYRVVANVNLERIEPLQFRLDFRDGTSAPRVVKDLVRTPPGTGVQPVELGETRLSTAELEALVSLTGRHKGRLPEIQDIRLIPVSNRAADVETRAYPQARYPTPPHALPPPPLFPTGNLERLPEPAAVEIPQGDLVPVPPPPDAAARRAAFTVRNDPRGIEVLAQRLRRALDPQTPGLEAFEAAMDRGDFGEALEAYRAFFFAKLKNPAAHGAAPVDLRMDFFQKDGKLRYVARPDPREVERNLAGIVQRWVLGPPGTVPWAPHAVQPPPGVGYERGPDSSPFWKSPEGQALHESIAFFRNLNRFNHDSGDGPFGALLMSYLMTGDRDHLRVYADYLDDWALHVDADLDGHPFNLRAAVELQVIGGYLARLRVILDERPAVAEDFPAPALVRILLNLTEMYHPYMVRAKRAELANWGIMGLAAALKESRLLHEFRAMRSMNRECSRLARINWIQHVALDGESLEAWDEGHCAIDGMLGPTRVLGLFGSPVMGPLEQQTLLDHHKVMQRSLLTHYAPDGNYWSTWLPFERADRKTITGKILARSWIDDVYDEPEVRRRVDAVFDAVNADHRLPLSDVQPYGALYSLRDGFGGDSTWLVMQNFPVRSQSQGIGFNDQRGHVQGSVRTQYEVARGTRSLLTGGAITVDGKPPNRWVDAIPTGGKTDYSMPTPRRVQAGRFHASALFDVAETIQDSPYAGYRFSKAPDVFGLGSPVPDEAIRDVRAVRQVFHLHGAGIFLVADRIENPGPEREYAMFFLLPTYGFALPGKPAQELPLDAKLESLRALAEEELTLLEVDSAGNRVRTANPGFHNVSVQGAGRTYQWGGRRTAAGSFEPVSSITAADLWARARAARDPARVFADALLQRVSMRWRGVGNQAAVTVIATAPPDAAGQAPRPPDPADFRDETAGGVAGCAFRTPAGADVWLRVSPGGRRLLEGGTVAAEAGTLLVTRQGDTIAGIVLDGDAVRVSGTRYAGAGTAFEFVMDAGGGFRARPIRGPIDTTLILPRQTVFTDALEVTFEFPTQDTGDIEFRYTLDGSDPTLASARSEQPLRLTQDTLVKVRPFRTGLPNTPWNIAGVEAGKTVWAIFRKQAPLRAEAVDGLKPGLSYRYYEGPWAQLMSHGGLDSSLDKQGSGAGAPLLDAGHLAAVRKTDRAYQVKYGGFIRVPHTGVYTFHAPEHLYDTTMDAGYDLRVWVGGEEWFPNPDLHAENTWSVALEAGLHPFAVSYTDFRWRRFRNEYLMTWREEQVWQGTPVLEVEGPGLRCGPIPSDWLQHR